VVTWTANSRREWKRLIAAQVDGIITDKPGALIEYLRERGLRQ
jgi:glycerophosphoryl diester phosphodiesterase